MCAFYTCVCICSFSSLSLSLFVVVIIPRLFHNKLELTRTTNTYIWRREFPLQAIPGSRRDLLLRNLHEEPSSITNISIGVVRFFFFLRSGNFLLFAYLLQLLS